MVLIKKLEDIAAKWKEVTPGRVAYYEKGVKEPLKNWEEMAIAAEPAWESGVTDAVGRKAFMGGVKRVGIKKWQTMAIAKGVARFGPGIEIGAPYYEEGFKPFHEVIAAITLPARGRRGDPKNIERVRAIAAALHKKRVELRKAS